MDSWFPRTYDFSDSGQISEFTEDYLETSAFIIIKKHAELFKSFKKYLKINLSLQRVDLYEGLDVETLKIAVKFCESWIK